ncbi:MAG: hypothetical protein E5Y59_05730 [Mesorhizobium sp.]|nr:MAG: hypothetical protein E5Y59_05730 [Mesorhizobium sp.]
MLEERLDSNVRADRNWMDSYDALRPRYLLLRDVAGSLDACVRLLPSTAPTMVRDALPVLAMRSAASRSLSPVRTSLQPVHLREEAIWPAAACARLWALECLNGFYVYRELPARFSAGKRPPPSELRSSGHRPIAH